MLKPIILDVECIVCNKTLQKINHDPQEVARKMVKITNRRSRTPNWSLEEKQCLLELIKVHKEIVITKSNNGPNHSEEKDVAWNEILRKLALKFGSKFNAFSIKKVKTQWQNMKRIAREEITNNGPALEKYSRQSLEVCSILDIIRDGVLKTEAEHCSEPSLTANIEIKTECVDEDISQPSCSGENSFTYPENSQEKTNDTITLESSSSTISDQISDMDADLPEELQNMRKKSTFSMTESTYFDNVTNNIPFQKEIQEFIRYTEKEKQLKMESLKEERQVVRAMRETAELNKIIAEQKLKHVLWIKKQEMA
ncbi:uncharacterized protein LOC116778694 [Danaus plexippus]|uniref:uncharacterized protein LOC116778694 n=1 Tax=Danaus plexippus TaxID=13037 RepID=UPI0013C51CB7|nr:uncharacterized protein LOC116778694 [Danaus plexippus]